MAGPPAPVGSGGGGESSALGFSSGKEPTDLATWEWCAIIFIYVTTRCPVGTLSFHPFQRQLVRVASAVGGCSLEKPKYLEWWPRLSLGGPANRLF